MSKRRADDYLSKEEEDLDKEEESVSASETSSTSDDIDSCPEVSEENTDEGEDDHEEDDDDGDKEEELVVDFEFFDPAEIDYLGLKALLHSFLDGDTYDSSQLVDAIINQTAVGSVVKAAQDEDPVAVMTVFNPTTQSGEWVGQLRTFLEAKCADAHVRRQLTQAFEGKPATGLIINERLINCPPSIAPPLVYYLFDELEGVVADPESTEAERREFSFEQYLLFTRVYMDNTAPSTRQGEDGAGRKSKKAKAGGPDGSSAEGSKLLVYVRPEDEFLHASASWSFTFPVQNRNVTADELQPMRLVAAVPASAVPKAREALNKVLGNPAELGSK